MSANFWSNFKSGRAYRTARQLYEYRKTVLFTAGATYGAVLYLKTKIDIAQRDAIHPNTFLVWRFHDGSIVEQKSAGSNLSLLLSSSSAGDEPSRVMTLFDAVRTIRWIESDERITGIVADFSSHGQPNVPSYSLGLAQIEEIHDALTTMKQHRQQADMPVRTIAVTDTFSSQGQYVLATAFDEIYLQPSGEIPLTGLSASIPFYSRLISWLGINILAEARTNWKSMVAPYVQTALTPDQAENEIQLLNDLNDNMLTLIARSRYPHEEPEAALAKVGIFGTLPFVAEEGWQVKALSQKGPFSAKDAEALGLINRATFKSAILTELVGRAEEDLAGGSLIPEDGTKPRLHGFYHYFKTNERALNKRNIGLMDVGVVYLLGTIGSDSGDFGTASVIKGLKEAARDPDIKAVILRIDSGGGGVVESESIWDAVNQVKASGKIVIASFGNASASGGYLVASHADVIMAHPSTITGSIGVASIRPTVTQTFLDRFMLNAQSFFTGGKSQSLLHDLEGDDLERHRRHIDATYEMFKQHVVEGRKIAPEEIEALAGGRVYSGLRAFGLAADPELINKFKKAQNLLPLHEEAPEEGEIPPVQIDEDQSLSPFAIPSIVNEPSEEQHSVFDAVKGESPPLGPKGRGLIDHLAGLCGLLISFPVQTLWLQTVDAASIGVELGVLKALAEAKQQNPDLGELELVEETLPGQPIEMAEDGTLIFAFDVRLKSFPEERGLWATALQAARQGDAIDPDLVSIWRAAKIAVLSCLTRAIQQSLAGELEDLGIPVRNLLKKDARRLEMPYRVSL